ncbi:MAG: helix-turn-helix domain-containing protein [Candidatus Sericytochromatia bacterium]
MQARDEALIAKRLGERLLELRTERGFSLRGAAKLIGIEHGRLSSFESGIERTTGLPTMPSVPQIIEIARAYRYPKERLLAEAGYLPWMLDGREIDRLLENLKAESSPSQAFTVAEQQKGRYGEIDE